MSKNKWLQFAFHILIKKYILLKNKIYVKIQCEKLYKLQTKVYFNNIDFVLEKKATLCDQFSLLRKPIAQNAEFFQHENYKNIINCGTFQPVSYGISGFY